MEFIKLIREENVEVVTLMKYFPISNDWQLFVCTIQTIIIDD